ncbi:transcriptional regulator [Streptococcus sobrinus]|nr:transcriptional regulator [Streptococcus sobrinus]
MKKSTINDVAKLAKVSRGTVSNFINGKPIRKENRERIAEAIRQLNYVPNVMARELKTSKSSTVVFIVPTNWTPFFSELVYHMQVELDQNGYKMILVRTCLSHASGIRSKRL